ncbi:MAG TPA: hypothetical protein VF267_11880 [Gammaproteobacteria bacterium]
MVSLAQLWLPILLSAVGVFVASSVLHMLLKFWHTPDYKGFSNEDEVRAAVRAGKPAAGIYMLPFCSPENMNSPEMRQKFEEGPVGVMFLRRTGMANMGVTLAQWFVFTVIVSVIAAHIAAVTLSAGAPGERVFHVVGVITFMAYALGVVPYAIWWGQTWSSIFKDIVDGLVYGAITGALFAWLWPAAGG